MHSVIGRHKLLPYLEVNSMNMAGMPTDAEVAQHDETSRLLSHSEAISSYDGTNSNAASEPLAEPVTSHEVKTALSHLAYVRKIFMRFS